MSKVCPPRSRFLLLLATALWLVSLATVAVGQQARPQAKTFSVEVYQVLGLPLNIHEASLVERESSFVLRCRVSSESFANLLGMRYSLTTIDPVSGAHPIANRIEGFKLDASGSRTVTFSTPIRFKPKNGDRIVLMIEQVIGGEVIWEVIKAKDALDAYVKGDYSGQPTVMRVANQIDAPVPVTRIIY